MVWLTKASAVKLSLSKRNILFQDVKAQFRMSIHYQTGKPTL